MPATTGATQAELIATASARLQALDPLLPEAEKPKSSCGQTFSARDASGRQVAIAGCDHWVGEPGSIALLWGQARRFRLTPVIATDDVGPALHQLLVQWHRHLAPLTDADDDDSSAVISWPSRDVAGVLTLQRHGLIPTVVVAARRTSLDDAADPAPTAKLDPGVVIRRAGPADLDAVTSLGLELVRYDSWFGSVTMRPDAESLLRESSRELLTSEEPWIWLAERDGTAIGMVGAEPPEAAQWVAPLTRLSPAAYLQQGIVHPGERGTGVGAALTAELHAQLRRARVPVTLLHHSQVNPLSAPFWSQQGYRPLWTSWSARPASTLR